MDALNRPCFSLKIMRFKSGSSGIVNQRAWLNIIAGSTRYAYKETLILTSVHRKVFN
ncbi:MAG: hypothetical protein ACFCUM_17740 [Bacteroidales bacterium]